MTTERSHRAHPLMIDLFNFANRLFLNLYNYIRWETFIIKMKLKSNVKALYQTKDACTGKRKLCWEKHFYTCVLPYMLGSCMALTTLVSKLIQLPAIAIWCVQMHIAIYTCIATHILFSLQRRTQKFTVLFCESSHLSNL